MLRLAAVVLALGASAATWQLLTGSEAWAGEVVWVFSATHGLHRGDIAVLAGWFGCLLLAVLLWEAGRRPRPKHRGEPSLWAEVAPAEVAPTHRLSA